MENNEQFDILQLPKDDLDLRRSILNKEIEKVFYLRLNRFLQNFFKENKTEFESRQLGIPISMSFEFYMESDDEGGSVPYLSHLTFYDDEGNKIDLTEITHEEPSWNGQYTYTVDLMETLRDKMYDYKNEMYEYLGYEDTYEFGRAPEEVEG